MKLLADVVGLANFDRKFVVTLVFGFVEGVAEFDFGIKLSVGSTLGGVGASGGGCFEPHLEFAVPRGLLLVGLGWLVLFDLLLFGYEIGDRLGEILPVLNSLYQGCQINEFYVIIGEALEFLMVDFEVNVGEEL